MGRKNLLSDTDYTSGKDNRYYASIHIGRVAEVICDETQAAVRVVMPDKLDHNNKPLITKPIPVWQISAGKKRSFAVPRVGQNVVLLKMPNGTANYHVVGTFYTTSDPPPVTDPLLDYCIYDEGSVKQFDANNGTETWKLKGDVIWDNEKGASLKFREAVTIESTESGITIKAPSGTVLVEASQITLKGPLRIEGDITHIGNMNTSGVHTDANGVHT